MTNYPKLLSLVPVTILVSLLSPSLFNFVDCIEAEGKAIYSSSPTHNPISTYFKEQKNKLRPYFATRPGGGGGLDLSDLYPEELTVHDDTQSASHSGYYDGGGSDRDAGIPAPAPSPYRPPDLLTTYPNPVQEDHHTNYLNLNPSWDMSGASSSPDGHAESSNAMYSVVDPHGYPTGSSPLSSPYSSGNPGGYFNGGPPPSFHGPGLPGGSSGSGGYYGGGGGHHDNSIYSQPPSQQGYYGNSGGGGSPPVSSSPHHHHPPPANNGDKSNDNLAASSNHVDAPTDTYTYPSPGGAGAGSNGMEYQSGMIMDDELIDMEDHNPQIAPPDYSPYDYQSPFDGGENGESDLFAAPGDDAAGAPAAGGGGAGSSDTAAQTTNDAAPAQPPPENPLNFLNLVGTDFQPGRLVNIFFGLFIMLFMIIFHGYALWVLGIAYLPGTRSFGGSSQWDTNWDKVNEACELVLDALEYWENKLEEK